MLEANHDAKSKTTDAKQARPAPTACDTVCNKVIYTIRNHNDKNLVYVGETSKSLYLVLHEFLRNCINPKCSQYKMKVGEAMRKSYLEGWYIQLVDNNTYESVKDLKLNKGKLIREIGTLNEREAGRDVKKYYEDHRDRLLSQHKKYYNDNRDKVFEQRKKYTKQKNLIQLTCECGTFVKKFNLSRHCKSQTHLKWLNTQKDEDATQSLTISMI